MKYLKLTGTLLLFIIGVTAILSLVMPVKQKIEKTITINAPVADVYRQIASLKNFNSWLVWNQRDSSVSNTITGTDATPGAVNSWSGDPAISGEGKMEIIALEENKLVKHSISFLSPRKGHALSTITLHENSQLTTVTWNFEMDTPRPWNIFNLFYNMEKQMGKDFEEGLASLKAKTEQLNGTVAKAYKVELMNFPGTRFAMIRQEVKWNDISAFFAQHLPLIDTAIKKTGSLPGTAAGLYYVWDEKNQQADMAAAVPIAAGTTLEDGLIQVTNIPSSKAVWVNYEGPYDKLAEAYASIDNYLKENKLTQKTPVIEQYIRGPVNEKDSTKWLTKIVFLVE